MAFVVRSVDEGFADAMRWHFAPFHVDKSAVHSVAVDLFVQEEDLEETPKPYSLFVVNQLIYRWPVVLAILRHAIWKVHSLLPHLARDFVFLHSGAVARDGRGLLLPARMDSGKTSLVLSLLGAGYDYMSDEFGALDPITGRAYPAPKHMSLDAETLRFFPELDERLEGRGLSAELEQRFVRAEDVGAVASQEPAEVCWIVFPTSSWEGPPRLSPIPAAEAVGRMAETAFNLYRYGERGAVLLSRVAARAQAFELAGGTPRERAELLAERLN